MSHIWGALLHAPRYTQQLVLGADGSLIRGLSTQAGQALERWLQSWEFSTPPVSFLPGTDPPTALSWLRRRGPAFPDALLHRLFQREVVRVYDPTSGQISRARKARPLPPGAQLLVPRALLAEARTVQAAAEGRGPRGGAAPGPPSPELQRLRLGWLRELRRRVLYQDADLIAVDKPAGLAVQGGSGVAVSVDGIMGAAFARLVPDPSQLRLVHRLDQQTTGVLVIATSPDSAAWLSQGFRGGSADVAAARREPGTAPGPGGAAAAAAKGNKVQIRKTYWGMVAKQQPQDVVEGWDTTVVELPERGEIDLPVSTEGRRGLESSGGSSAGSQGEQGQEGAAALTLFTLRQQNDKLAWLELRPMTGRKHQLRIHCARGLGTPILGDSRYGAVRSPLQREVLGQLLVEGAWSGNAPPMFLHCRSILIKKPGVREAVRLVAPPPPHWQALLRLQRWAGGEGGSKRAQASRARRQP